MPRRIKNKKRLDQLYSKAGNSFPSQGENQDGMYWGLQNSIPEIQPMKPISGLGRHIKAKQPQPKYSIGSSSANEMHGNTDISFDMSAQPQIQAQAEIQYTDPFAPQSLQKNKINWSDRSIDPNAPMKIKLPNMGRNNTFNSASSSLFSSGSFGSPSPVQPQRQSKQPSQKIQYNTNPSPEHYSNQQQFVKQPPKIHISAFKKVSPPPKLASKKPSVHTLKNRKRFGLPIQNLLHKSRRNPLPAAQPLTGSNTIKKNNRLAIAKAKAVNLKNKALQGTKKLGTRIKNKFVSLKRKIIKPNQFRYRYIHNSKSGESGKLVSETN